MIYKIHRVSKPSVPIKAYIDIASFKIYKVDIGLLGTLSELDVESVINGNDIFVEFKGAFTEQFVMQELISQTSYKPYNYSTETASYEVDFLIQKEGNIVPIEVKSEDNLKAKSLKFYCDKYNPVFAIRTSMSGYREEAWMRNIPLWAISRISEI